MEGLCELQISLLHYLYHAKNAPKYINRQDNQAFASFFLTPG